MHNTKFKGRLLLGVFVFVLLVLGFEIFPLASVVAGSFTDGNGGFTLKNYITAFTNPFYLQSIINSIALAVYSSLAGIIVALAGAYSVSKLSAKTRDKILMLSNMTSNFAGVPLAFAFIIILGNSGVFVLLFKYLGWDISQGFNLYSATGLILVYIYFQIPLGILLLYPTLDAIKVEWKEAALLLGASPYRFWVHIGIPVLLPGIIGTFNVLFANAMGAYATAVALTNGSNNLLTIRIGALISGDIFTDPQQAGALSVILALILVAVNLANRKLLKVR
jgi:ABC-type uncharacterized transport system, permease component